jgi:isochorismate synthase
MTSGIYTGPAERLRSPVLDPADRESLLETCLRAGDRARRTGNPVLASWAAARSVLDPVEVWSRGRTAASRSFLWHSAWDQGSVVAFGTAHDLRGSGEDRVESVARRWARLSRETVAGASAANPEPTDGGPRALGGFAFDADGAAGEGRLPDALLWVPAVQLSGKGPDPLAQERSASFELRLNAVLTHIDDPESVAAELERLMELHLSEPDEAGRRSSREAGGGRTTQVEVPSADDWKKLVRQATDRIQAGDFEKVVLARELRVIAATPFDVPAAVRRLRETYPGTTLFAVDYADRTFLGATPEYLARVENRTVHSLGLAGTMPRGSTPEQDEALERELRESPKIQHEHDVVVRAIGGVLRDSCAEVTVETPPRVVKLANVQHLSTRMHGRLAEDSAAGILDFAGRLHPTPALGGHPRAAALAWLGEHEGIDRGWYAGGIGWADAAGQGQFAVAIRSALIEGSHARLYAGCGLVADSDPEAEYAESCAKLRPMIAALEVE